MIIPVIFWTIFGSIGDQINGHTTVTFFAYFLVSRRLKAKKVSVDALSVQWWFNLRALDEIIYFKWLCRCLKAPPTFKWLKIRSAHFLWNLPWDCFGILILGRTGTLFHTKYRASSLYWQETVISTCRVHLLDLYIPLYACFPFAKEKKRNVMRHFFTPWPISTRIPFCSIWSTASAMLLNSVTALQ
jgi:hypothetical protein